MDRHGAKKQLGLALVVVLAAALLFHFGVTIGGTDKPTTTVIYETNGRQAIPHTEVETNISNSYPTGRTIPDRIDCPSDLELKTRAQIVCSLRFSQRDPSENAYAMNVKVSAVDVSANTYSAEYQLLDASAS